MHLCEHNLAFGSVACLVFIFRRSAVPLLALVGATAHLSSATRGLPMLSRAEFARVRPLIRVQVARIARVARVASVARVTCATCVVGVGTVRVESEICVVRVGTVPLHGCLSEVVVPSEAQELVVGGILDLGQPRLRPLFLPACIL